jgi:hypothetical protein
LIDLELFDHFWMIYGGFLQKKNYLSLFNHAG